MESALDKFIGTVTEEILLPLIMLLAVIAFAVFVWGVVQMIIAAGDEEKRTIGQKHILWGIIGLVIIFGAYGIINIALGTFSLPLIQKIS